jgi:hypothetical protein
MEYKGFSSPNFHARTERFTPIKIFALFVAQWADTSVYTDELSGAIRGAAFALEVRS